MKKMMLLAAMMVGTAGAQMTQAATGAVQFSTRVNNVCGLSTTPGGGNVTGGPIAAGTLTAGQSSYDALQSTPSSSSFGPFGSLQCTKGTALTLDVSSATGLPSSATGTTTPLVASNTMNLVSGTNTLAGSYNATLSKTETPTNGDLWAGAFSFTPTSGQWNSPAGTYTGTINFTISYN